MTLWRSMGLTALLFWLVCWPAAANMPVTEQLKQQLEEVKGAADADPQLVQSYETLLATIDANEKATQANQTLRDFMTAYNGQMSALQQQLDQVPEDPLFGPPPSEEPDDVELALTALDSAEADWRRQLSRNKQAMQQVERLPEVLPGELSDLSRQLRELTPVEPNEATPVPYWQFLANTKKLNLAIEGRQLQLQSYDKKKNALELEQQLLQSQLSAAQTQRERLQGMLSQTKQTVAQDLLRQSSALVGLAPEQDAQAKKTAEQLKRLARELSELVSSNDDQARRRQQLEQQTRQLTSERELIANNIQWLQKSTAFGATLRAKLRALPEQAPNDDLVGQIAQAHVRQFSLRQLPPIVDPRTLVNESEVEADPSEPASEPSGAANRIQGEADNDSVLPWDPEQSAAFWQQAESLQQQLVQQLDEEYEQFIITLTHLQTVREQYHLELTSSLSYLKQQQLWTRSHPPLWQWPEGFNRFTLLGIEQPLLDTLAQLRLQQPRQFALALVAVLAFGFALSRSRQHRRALAALPTIKQSFKPFRAKLFASLTGAVLMALMVVAMSKLLTAFWPQPEPLDIQALLTLAVVITLLMATLFTLGSPGGVLRDHLDWPKDYCNTLQRQAIASGLPSVLLLLAMMLGTLLAGAHGSELVRWLQLAVQALLLVLFLRMVAPRSLERVLPTVLRRPWFLKGLQLVVLTTQAVAFLLTVLGYYYAGLSVTLYLSTTMMVIVLFFIAGQLGRGWLLAEQHELRQQRLREEWLEQQAARQSEEGSAPAEPMPEIDEEQIELDEVNQQSFALLKGALLIGLGAALLGIWGSAVEQVQWFNDVVLWQVIEQTESGATLVNISLRSVLIAIGLLLLTLFAVQNLPGMLELLVLRRLDLQPGSGYAITTILRYLVILTGVMTAFAMVGFQWSKLQWLVAAVGVGLGFGLQEIFANFVSGLIILFERPIRIGDIVTINNLSGTVSRINTRATTIIDWDMKEIVVPNKAFITDQLINWSLTDPMTRVVISVGVAYGSDIDKAEELLHEVARDHPTVLDDPAPQVFFLSFGASSLDFELRLYIPAIESRNFVIHAINKAIDRRFREANIEIAFPQLDLHVRELPKAPPEDKGNAPND
ncbi:mechanosensitive ion channel domain-containing protein [Ferrimonas marina]|uniref:Potassium efflux system protein n=1 Tax=Ferrimonas marina TaxID=299255 RepID=A0A1M5RW70_9GAMM|nr:mechanosensitive ion channel domain-containing protein [Ferrimonas marina]SHH30562.1 potassium efflux system protein [Ferrimonas marina]